MAAFVVFSPPHNRYASKVGDTLIIVNPNAQGGRIRKHVHAIRTIADKACAHVFVSDSVSHTQKLLQKTPLESRVIVAGGDGTVQHLLKELAERRHALGILPLGSGNDGARALGTYANNWRETLLRLLATQHVRAVDLGCAEFDDRAVHFLVALNAGFDASVAHRAVTGPKLLHGLPRYLLATVRELAKLTHWSITIDLDNQRIHQGDTLFASTLNTPTYGSGMPAVPHARVDDGVLDLLVAGHFSRSGALAMLPRLLQGTHLSDTRLRTRAFAALTINSEHPLPLAADGEFLGTTHRLDISVKARRLLTLAL